MTATNNIPKRHLLTVGVDDYFHAEALKSLVSRQHWERFERRVEQNTLKTLTLLQQHQVHATFFVMGWVAEHHPDLVKEIAAQGHEVANQGYGMRRVRELTRDEFRRDLLRAHEALQRATGRAIVGYRTAKPVFRSEDLWILDVLAKEGYAYDSSLLPVSREFKGQPWQRVAHTVALDHRQFWEVPYSTWALAGWSFPIGGGNYFRQLPRGLMRTAVRNWHRNCNAPFVMYFHVWDLDPDQPRVSAAPFLARIRQYRNLEKMRDILGDYLAEYRFTSIADHLGVRPGPAAPLPCAAAENFGALAPALGSAPATRPAVSIVIPCYNEAAALTYLANTLASVEAELSNRYELRFVFVDDGSTDSTAHRLHELFGGRPNCQVISHERNRGVAAAIVTGIHAAQTEVVCSLDCDCTYNPHELGNLISLLTPGVDLVTGSPYHPEGHVNNVPGWRLALSRGASSLYRLVLRQKLATYTSCFRAYRRSTVTNITLEYDGFLGVAELLGKACLRGLTVREYPTTLDVRLFGTSKMKIARTVLGHLRLLTRLAVLRLSSTPASAPPTNAPEPVPAFRPMDHEDVA